MSSLIAAHVRWRRGDRWVDDLQLVFLVETVQVQNTNRMGVEERAANRAE
jgi:hypothetical protein